MAGTSSSSSDNVPPNHFVDDFYFSALFDDGEIFPISDEKYAQELKPKKKPETLQSSSQRLIKSEPTTSSDKEVKTVSTEHAKIKESKKCPGCNIHAGVGMNFAVAVDPN
ncbi:hypothetical protein PanWU01x14_261320 [Parasponia andersonii]|uniref:Uncharacterized protein n=1 Tax=Parasponia andersonii TaxID=3476 RepID=A0A2P5B8I6_PARAD|nr:hypothetical protein PanWU01x14_261320 [Parasponia andersonii]